MQRQDKVYAASSELSAVRMPIVSPMQKWLYLFSIANAKTKTQLKLICQILDSAYKIQKNFTV